MGAHRLCLPLQVWAGPPEPLVVSETQPWPVLPVQDQLSSCYIDHSLIVYHSFEYHISLASPLVDQVSAM